jgi:GTP cyclohydrolase II
MKILFHPEAERLECKVTITIPYHGDVLWTFSCTHSDKYYAALACLQMQEQMGGALSAMRQEAYEKGWKDARSRKVGKDGWFSRQWKHA